jgi:outer membrane lipoprotein
LRTFREPRTKLGAVFSILFLFSCAQSAHQTGRALFDQSVPPGIRQDIDWKVSFPELLASPAQYQGHMVVLGGIVLDSKRTNEGTELEMLQLPLTGGVTPADQRGASQGRFLAIESAGLDPAAIDKGTHLTVVGTVEGEKRKPLDETDYTYPVVRVKSLVNWTKAERPRYYGAGPYYDAPYYGYYGYPGMYPGMYGAYSPWWGPFRGPYVPYYFFGPGLSGPGAGAPPAAAPPPAAVPPQFRKRE